MPSMSVIEIIIRLVAVVVLAGFLYLKHRQRARCLSGEYDPAQWTGAAIDAGKLKPAVERVHQGYLKTGEPSHHGCHPKALLAMARRVVARLTYFRDREIRQEEKPLQAGASHQ